MTEQAARKPSVSTVDSYRPEPTRTRTGAHRFMWQSFSAPDNSSPTPPSEGSLIEDDSFVGPSTPQPLPPTSPVPISPRNESLSPLPSRATSWRDGFVRRFSPDNTSGDSTTKHSVVDIFTVLRKHPDQSDSSTPISQIRLTNSRGQTIADAELDRTRDKIQRQLRFLFIYPLVYIGMWILPLVSHGMQYSDRFAVDPPFVLTCFTTVSICMQAAVDAWLFSTREKPWRHIPGTNGDFWVSLKFWADWTGFRKRRVLHGPGKTKDEMVREAKAAYRRRDEELAQRRIEADVSVGQRETGARRAEWWESVGVDGAMSPVHEEVSNPMEDVIVFNEEAFSDSGNTLKGTDTKLSKEDEKAPEEPEVLDADSPIERGSPTDQHEKAGEASNADSPIESSHPTKDEDETGKPST